MSEHRDPADAHGTVFIVTEEDDLHVDAVVHELKQRGVPVFRLHPADFPERVHITLKVLSGRLVGTVEDSHHQVNTDDVSRAWFRRIGPSSRASSGPPAPDTLEAFVNVQTAHTLQGLWHAIGDRWINSPLQMVRHAENKPLQLAAAQAVGLLVPPTIITNNPDDALSFRESILPSLCAAKPLRIKGVRDERTYRFPLTNAWTADVDRSAISASPTIFQPMLAKSGDIRAVVLQDEVLAAFIHSGDVPGAVYDVRAVQEMRHSAYDLPGAVKDKLVALCRHLGISFASADHARSCDGGGPLRRVGMSKLRQRAHGEQLLPPWSVVQDGRRPRGTGTTD